MRLFVSVPAIVFVSLFAAIVFASVISGAVSVGASANVRVTELSIAKPTTQAGDVLLATIATDSGSTNVVTPPEGWTLALRTSNGTNVSILTYWKAATASEPASYLWTVRPTTNAVGGITAYSGVDPANPIDVASGNSGNSANASTPAITTTADGAMIVASFATPAGALATGHFSTPAGMTEKYDTANTPTGPSLASSDMLQITSGLSAARSSNIGTKRKWAAQQIALRHLQEPQQFVATDDFNASSDGPLDGQNGGAGWNSAWSGSSAFEVQGGIAEGGSKVVKVSQEGGQEPTISRSFNARTSGTLHWSQRKDGTDHTQGIVLLSGSTPVGHVYMSSANAPLGTVWAIGDGEAAFSLVPYTTSTWYTVDVEFDTDADQYRASINSGSFSEWRDLQNPAASVDTIRIETGADGFGTTEGYWDDIQIQD
ncbi:MAG: hypothetical protein WA021_05415 [Minisyncoccia bacterium]